MNTKTWHNIICAKKTILGILLNELVKMVDIQERLLTTHWLRVMKSKKRKQTKKQKKQQKQRSKPAPTNSTPTNFNEKKGNL